MRDTWTQVSIYWQRLEKCAVKHKHTHTHLQIPTCHTCLPALLVYVFVQYTLNKQTSSNENESVKRKTT